jgi:hypothetical protein
MGLETGVQNPLGRIDVAALAPRPDVVVEPRTVLAMQAAFQQAQEMQNQQHDRTIMAPAVEARSRLAADPAMIDATKRQAVAGADEAQADAILKKQQALAAAKALGLPPGIGHLQEDLIKEGVFIMPEQNEQPTDFASRVQHTWRKHEAWKTEVAANEANLQGVDRVNQETQQGTFLVPVAKGSSRPLDPNKIAAAEQFKQKFSTRFDAWTGEPAPDLYGSIAPGQVEAAPSAAPVPQDAPMRDLQGNDVIPPVAPAAPNPAAPVGAPTPNGLQVKLPPQSPHTGRAPTEVQIKSANFVARALNANEVFGNLQQVGYDPGLAKNWVQDFFVGPLASLKTTDQRQYNAARDSWVQGLLRLESGAAISNKEESWYRNTFFPGLGDPPSVAKQKELMRADVEKIADNVSRGGGLDAGELYAIRRQAESLSQSEAAGGNSAAPAGKTVNISGLGQVTLQTGPDGRTRIIPSGGASSGGSASGYVAPSSLKKSTTPAVEPKVDPRKATKDKPIPGLIPDPLFK